MTKRRIDFEGNDGVKRGKGALGSDEIELRLKNKLQEAIEKKGRLVRLNSQRDYWISFSEKEGGFDVFRGRVDSVLLSKNEAWKVLEWLFDMSRDDILDLMEAAMEGVKVDLEAVVKEKKSVVKGSCDTLEELRGAKRKAQEQIGGAVKRARRLENAQRKNGLMRSLSNNAFGLEGGVGLSVFEIERSFGDALREFESSEALKKDRKKESSIDPSNNVTGLTGDSMRYLFGEFGYVREKSGEKRKAQEQIGGVSKKSKGFEEEVIDELARQGKEGVRVEGKDCVFFARNGKIFVEFAGICHELGGEMLGFGGFNSRRWALVALGKRLGVKGAETYFQALDALHEFFPGVGVQIGGKPKVETNFTAEDVGFLLAAFEIEGDVDVCTIRGEDVSEVSLCIDRFLEEALLKNDAELQNNRKSLVVFEDGGVVAVNLRWEGGSNVMQAHVFGDAGFDEVSDELIKGISCTERVGFKEKYQRFLNYDSTFKIEPYVDVRGKAGDVLRMVFDAKMSLDDAGDFDFDVREDFEDFKDICYGVLESLGDKNTSGGVRNPELGVVFKDFKNLEDLGRN